MPTANERRALWFLAIVAISGSVVRLVRARSAPAPDAVPDAQLEHQLTRIDSAREHQNAANKHFPNHDRSRRDTIRAGPRGPDTTVVDLDRASAQEIAALPGMRQLIAERIVQYRDSAGGLGSFEALCRVRGVGPTMVGDLRKRVVFSGISQERGTCGVATAAPSKSHVTKRGKPR